MKHTNNAYFMEQDEFDALSKEQEHKDNEKVAGTSLYECNRMLMA